MEIPDEMLNEIRESGYDQELVYNYIRELLNSDKQINDNNNLELIDNYLLDKDLQEPAAEIQMAAEIIDNYLLDKRFMREIEDEEYDAAWLDKVPIFSYLFKGYSFEQITGLK